MKKTTITITAPSSHFKATMKNFKAGVRTLENSGAVVRCSNNIFKKDGTFAGTLKERSADIIDAIKDKKTDVIMFARGGYGMAQLLPMLDKHNIAPYIKNKKFVGCSDITALFCFLYTKYGKKCFYGPNVNNHNLAKKIVPATDIKIKHLVKTKNNVIAGRFFGGCLSVITSLVGTKYLKKLDGHILFIEDVNEPPYKIDRMLTQLLQAGIIKRIKAIAVGSMKNCDAGHQTWKAPVTRIAKILDVPVIYGINAGHGGFDFVLPLGGKSVIKQSHLYLK
ncbi:MAG: LD-carboxypeptidase [Pseudomonadota bacterium]